MSRKIIPLQRENAVRVFHSEWTHQLTAIEQSVNFFEEYFLWSTQQLSLRALDPQSGGSPEYEKFYHGEAPLVSKEAREAIKILKLLCRNEQT